MKNEKNITQSKNVVSDSNITGNNIHIGDVYERTPSKTEETNKKSNPTQKNSIKNIKEFIIKGDINGAIKVLLLCTDSTEYHDDSILLSSRQNGLENKITKGIISVDDADLQQTKITNSIIQIVNKLEENQST